MFRWQQRRGPKASVSTLVPWGSGAIGEGTPPPPGNFEFIHLGMACFGLFCGAAFGIFTTARNCKTHTLNALFARMDVKKRNRPVIVLCVTLKLNHDLNTVIQQLEGGLG